MNAPAAAAQRAAGPAGVRPHYTVALIGNPNTGKSTLFNALTGLRQAVGNYPGCTVEKKTGSLVLDGVEVEVLDLPGTYSLAARSPDEMIAVDVLIGQQAGAAPVDAIIAIADASNPERNFYLLSQLLEAGKPVILAVNMLDVAESKGLTLDLAKLSAKLGVPAVGLCANSGKGIPELKAELAKVLTAPVQTPNLATLPSAIASEVNDLCTSLAARGRTTSPMEAFRALVDKGGYAETRLVGTLGPAFLEELAQRRTKASAIPLAGAEVRARYAWVQDTLRDVVTRPAKPPVTLSDKIDRVITHWFSGTVIFTVLMVLVFQAIYSWSGPLMGLIEFVFGKLSESVGALFTTEGPLKALVTDGIIAGVGGVLVFLPQICVLFLFIAVLEDCGYMARAAFLMDRLFSKVGLSGKSFIPMLSSFACAIPGVMATRTIENWRDRLATMMIAPLMSCSARLPVYIIMIYTFIPAVKVIAGPAINLGLFTLDLSLGLQGLVLMGMYAVGLIVAIPVAWLLKMTLLKGETPPFLIELPSYKWPSIRTVVMRVADRAWAFIVRAGTIILAVSIIVWALSYFPRPDAIKNDYAARIEANAKELEATEAAAGKDVEKDALEKAIAAAEAAEKTKAEATEAKKPEPGSDDEKVIQAAYELEMKKAAEAHAKAWPAAEKIVSARAASKEKVAELSAQEEGAYQRQSYFGRMGHAIEPAVKPLGWDWRIGMATLASFPAREVIVATLGQIFNLGKDQDESSEGLRTALRDATWDNSDRKLFNIPVALSVMVFFALCSQCAATLAAIKRETNSWFWPVFSFVYMTLLAYIGAFIAYQGGMALGWGG